MTEVQQLEAVYRRIRRKHDWCQGTSMAADGRVCLVGAVWTEIPDPVGRYVVRRRMDDRARDRGYVAVTHLNDTNSHHYVLKFLRQLIREAKQREKAAIRARREEEIRNMNIGKEERTIIVEPLQDPVPQRETQPAPEPTPRRQPVKEPEREKVGA